MLELIKAGPIMTADHHDCSCRPSCLFPQSRSKHRSGGPRPPSREEDEPWEALERFHLDRCGDAADDLAIADGGRGGNARSIGEVDSSPDARKRVRGGSLTNVTWRIASTNPDRRLSTGRGLGTQVPRRLLLHVGGPRPIRADRILSGRRSASFRPV